MSKFIVLSVLLAVGLESQAKPSPNLGLQLFNNANSFIGQSANDAISEIKDAVNTGMEIRNSVRDNFLSIFAQLAASFNPINNIPANIPTNIPTNIPSDILSNIPANIPSVIPTGAISAGLGSAANVAALANPSTAANAMLNFGGLGGRSAAKVEPESEATVENDTETAAEEDATSDVPAKTEKAPTVQNLLPKFGF